MRLKFRNADRLHHRPVRCESRERLHLIQRAPRHHQVEALFGAVVKFLARHINEVAFHIDLIQESVALALRLPVRQRVSRAVDHLQRADEPLPVIGSEPRRHDRITPPPIPHAGRLQTRAILAHVRRQWVAPARGPSPAP
jgi:hypothetical protein